MLIKPNRLLLFSAGLRVGGADSFLPLLVANLVFASSLYITQPLLSSLSVAFPHQQFLPMVPSLTLLGYAAGVGLIATAPLLESRLTILLHHYLLFASLIIAGCATNGTTLMIASFLIGLAAAATQRLLARARRSGTALGRLICGGLVGILAVRLSVEYCAVILGWRSVFFLAAGAVAASALVVFTQLKSDFETGKSSNNPGSALYYWNSHHELRHAAIQQAATFAIFNASWIAIFSISLGQVRSAVVLIAGGSGIVTSMISGRLADKFGRRRVATCGTVAAAIATGLLTLAVYFSDFRPLSIALIALGMALLEAGVQAALVANQTRVQELAPFARARLAAILTVSGFFGGTLGAGLEYWIRLDLSPEYAVGLVPAIGIMALSTTIVRLAPETRQ